MRIKFKLKTYKTNKITANYYYPLSCGVYKFLQFGSPEFSKFLHDKGYQLNGKKFKLFNFAFRFEKIFMDKGFIKLLSPNAELLISSPLEDDFIRNFIAGTFQRQIFEIYGNGELSCFEVQQAEYVPEPDFYNFGKFILLSPLVLSKPRIINGKTSADYLKDENDIEGINRLLNKNLKSKYEIITQKKFAGDDVKLVWDNNYIDKMKKNNKRLTKKITIKTNENKIDIIGLQIPFELSGAGELIKIGYACGFGEKNSMGFGMAEVR